MTASLSAHCRKERNENAKEEKEIGFLPDAYQVSGRIKDNHAF